MSVNLGSCPLAQKDRQAPYPNMLDATADIVILYCNRQKMIIEDYMRKMNTLSHEWQDDETLGKLLQEVKMLSDSVSKAMDILRVQYPPYFKKQALITHTEIA